MNKLTTLLVLGCLFLAAGAYAAAGPEGAWPCVGGDNQLTSRYYPLDPLYGDLLPEMAWQTTDYYKTAPGGIRGSVTIDADDNIYLSGVIDQTDAIQKRDSSGNLVWTVSVLSTMGNYTSGVLGNGGYWYVPCNGDSAGDYLLKIDTSDGTIIWTYLIGGGDKIVFGAAAMMDNAGDIYVRAWDTDGDENGYLYKVTDLDTTPSLVWKTLVSNHQGLPDPYNEHHHVIAVDPLDARVYNYSGAPDLALTGIDSATGTILWSTPVGFDAGDDYRSFTDSAPLVDDTGNVYIKVNCVDASYYGGIYKVDGDSGTVLWSWTGRVSWIGSGASHFCGSAGALSADQSKLYTNSEGVYWELETATGAENWEISAGGGGGITLTNGQHIVDAGGGVVLCGGWQGGLGRLHYDDDEGKWAVDFVLDPLELGLHDTIASYCAMDSEGSLIYPGEEWTTNYLFLAKYWAEGPPGIIRPLNIYSLDKDVPVRDCDCTEQILSQYGYIMFATRGFDGTVTYSIEAGALPDGLTLSEDGQLTGAPTTVGSYYVKVKATDGTDDAYREYNFDVVAGPVRIGPGLPLASVSWPYDGGLWILGGTPPYTVSVTAGKGDGGTGDGTLGSTGLTLNSDGTISGVPTAIGSATVEVTVTDSDSAQVTRDITVDVVDSRVWDTFQRTARRVGTSTLPIPDTYPQNLTGGYDYNAADTWTWSYEMIHAPLFAMIESDANDDGDHDGFMFVSAQWLSTPPEETVNAKWAACPYDVDPEGAHPNPLDFGGWTYSLTDNGWAGTVDPLPGVLKLNASDTRYAEKLYFSNDRYDLEASFGCLDPNTGSLNWKLDADMSAYPTAVVNAYDVLDFEGPKALLENGDVVTITGLVNMTCFDPAEVFGIWGTSPSSVSGYGLTYALIRDQGSYGQIVWTAGQENTADRAGKGPIFFRMSEKNLEDTNNSAYTALMNLADEGELVLVPQNSRGGTTSYIGDSWTIRADKVDNYTLWTIGLGGDRWTAKQEARGGTWTQQSLRACPVVDSTNHVYMTKATHRGGGAQVCWEPGIWAIDAIDAITNIETPPLDHEWEFFNSDPAITWYTYLADGAYAVPGTPCLSRDQRTLYTVVVPVGRLEEVNGEDFLVHWSPGGTAKLVALHTINGAIKWSKELQVDGLSGCDLVNANQAQIPAPLAGPDGKVVVLTRGDTRAWWESPGSARNPTAEPEAFDGLLKPVLWCVKDTGTDATVLWTRAMTAGDAQRDVGPCSLAVTPNYRLVVAGEVDPGWLELGGTYDRLEGIGVHLIHPMDDMEITNTVWNHSTTSVEVTFSSVDGVQYTLEAADADRYDDDLSWSDLDSATASGTSTTISDDVSTNPLAWSTFRFYRVKRAGTDPFYSNGTAAVFKMKLAIDWTMWRFFVGMPLEPHPNNSTVQGIFNQQLSPRSGPVLTQHVATGNVQNRMVYDSGTGLWSLQWGSSFDIAAGEGYFLSAGGGLKEDRPLYLVGMVPDGPLSIDVSKPSFTGETRWLCYCKPEPTTLENCGLRQAVTGWDTANRIRLRQLGSGVWTTYKWTGTQWENLLNPGAGVDPPLACGEAIHFIRKGLPPPYGPQDYWVQPNWYFHPPNRW
jgi:outer membrane protein assembly factor BamB